MGGQSALASATVICAFLAGLATAPGPSALAVDADGRARCAGLAATVEGSRGTLRGTPGRDVIVARGAVDRVVAGGGRDLICIRSRAKGFVHVDGGAGADRVLVQRRTRVMADLGPGADVYTGGPGPDWVRTGAGRDVVRTRAGDDSVTTGTVGSPNRDRIRLGPGDDVLRLDESRDHARALLRGGRGRDSLALSPLGKGALVVDAAGQRATLRAHTLASWRGFEDYTLNGAGRQVFRGTDAAQSVLFEGMSPVVATLAGGDDEVFLGWGFMGSTPLTLRGGEGNDLLGVTVRAEETVADLVTGRFESTDDGVRGFAFDGFEGLSALYDWNLMAGPPSPRIELVGNAGDNALQADACEVVLRGGAGDDHLRVGEDSPTSGLITYSPGVRRCLERGRSHVLGGVGDDVLVGKVMRPRPRGAREVPYDDILDGGEGLDTADGGAGRDTCLAEVTNRCEA